MASTLPAAIQPGENRALGTGGTPGRLRTTTLVVLSSVLTNGSAITSSNRIADGDPGGGDLFGCGVRAGVQEDPADGDRSAAAGR